MAPQGPVSQWTTLLGGGRVPYSMYLPRALELESIYLLSYTYTDSAYSHWYLLAGRVTFGFGRVKLSVIVSTRMY